MLAGVVAAALVGLTAGNASATSGTAPSSPLGQQRGVMPTVQSAAAARAAHLNVALAANTLSYGGSAVDGSTGVISGKPKVYLVFWGYQWGTLSTDSNGNLKFSNDTAGAAGRVQQLLRGLGTGGEQWSGAMTQYCDGVARGATSCPAGGAHVKYPTGGGTLAAAWYDNTLAAPSAASELQIRSEAARASNHFGGTTTSNRNAQYVIFSPKGTNPDNYRTGGFCAWHENPSGSLALTNLPYLLDAGASCGQNFVNAGSAGTLDGFTIVEGHEYAETLTDWDPPSGWTSSITTGQENADECAWISSGQGAAANVSMGNGSYPMQSTWSNDTNRCDISHPTVS